MIKESYHRAGINADILVGGVIRVGDPVVELLGAGRSSA